MIPIYPVDVVCLKFTAAEDLLPDASVWIAIALRAYTEAVNEPLDTVTLLQKNIMKKKKRIQQLLILRTIHRYTIQKTILSHWSHHNNDHQEAK
jgi:hypothetical protein